MAYIIIERTNLTLSEVMNLRDNGAETDISCYWTDRGKEHSLYETYNKWSEADADCECLNKWYPYRSFMVVSIQE